MVFACVFPRYLEVLDFGPVKSGKLEFGDFTVVCGRQNSGKTYLALLTFALVRVSSYVLDHLYSIIADYVREVKGVGIYTGDYLLDLVSGGLPSLRERAVSELCGGFVDSLIANEIRQVFGVSPTVLVRAGEELLTVRFSSMISVVNEVSLKWLPGLSFSFSVNRGGVVKVLDFVVSDEVFRFLAKSINRLEISQQGYSMSFRVSLSRNGMVLIPAERIGIMTSLYSILDSLIRLYGLERVFPELVKEINVEALGGLARPVVLEFARLLLERLKSIEGCSSLKLPFGGSVVLRKGDLLSFP